MTKRFGWAVAAAMALALGACDRFQGTTQEVGEVDNSTPQATISASDDTQLRDLVSSYLTDVQNQNAPGLSPSGGFSDEIVAMQPGAEHRWQVSLTGGTAYTIIGACDNECSNMDFELIDGSGQVVASDVLPDDFPIVQITPTANANYTLRMVMVTCTIAPCYAGARVLN